ncbi:hypothetical protein KUCAC02_022766, partial [Chaenocephalus aceratus]
SPCLSSRDRDPEYELEDGWSIGGDGTAAGGRWKPECPVVRQVAERSDAIGPGGCLLCWALQPEHCTQQFVYAKDKQKGNLALILANTSYSYKWSANIDMEKPGRHKAPKEGALFWVPIRLLKGGRTLISKSGGLASSTSPCLWFVHIPSQPSGHMQAGEDRGKHETPLFNALSQTVGIL